MQRHLYLQDSFWTKKYSGIYTVLKVNGGPFCHEIPCTSTEIIHLNGTITIGTPLPAIRAGHCMVTLNQNEILIIGGYPPRNKKQTMFYNIKSKTFNKVVTICENLMLLFIESRDSTGLNFEWGVWIWMR